MSMATVKTKDSFTHWWDPEGRKCIIIHRRSLRASTRRYLEKVPLIDGVSVDYANRHAVAAIHAETYIRLVRGELAHHNNDKDEALWTGMLFGPLFCQMWQSACSVNLRAFNVPADIKAFRGDSAGSLTSDAQWLLAKARALPDYVIEDWLAEETLETAELLAKAHVKAFAEFVTVCERSNEEPMVIRHHSSILAENMSDMLQLVIQGGEPTDLRLPDTHVHKQVALQQETARAMSASTLRNIYLGPA